MTAVQTKLHAEYPVCYKTARINDQNIFYREAGPERGHDLCARSCADEHHELAAIAILHELFRGRT